MLRPARVTFSLLLALSIVACGDDTPDGGGAGGATSSTGDGGGGADGSTTSSATTSTTTSASTSSASGGGEGPGGQGGGGGAGGSAPAAIRQARVSAGAMHTCAVGSAGQVACFGWNELGQLGDGTTTSKSLPVVAASLADVTTVAAGGAFTCALTAAGERWCWGNAGYGQLGDGTEEDALTPRRVDDGWLTLTAGLAHACGLRTDRSLWCWGDDDWGAVGTGIPDDVLSPVRITGETFRSVSAATWTTCGVTDGGELLCWGLPFWLDPFGVIPPTSFGADHAWAHVAVGEGSVCAIEQDGSLWCIGLNSAGQLGQGSTSADEQSFVRVGDRDDWAHADVDVDQVCAIDAVGDLWCWGQNTEGQVGVQITPETVAVTTPTQVSPGRTWTDVSCGGSNVALAYGGHTCAVDAEGEVACWGDPVHGQVGNGWIYDGRPPTPVNGDTDWVEVGGDFIARKADGSLWKWRAQGLARLDSEGAVTTYPLWAPRVLDLGLSAPDDALSRSAGGCALDLDGSIRCPRYDLETPLHQLTAIPFALEDVGGGTGYVRVEEGRFHRCAIHEDASLRCWGSNFGGELGDGTKIDAETPSPVAGGGTWRSAAAGAHHTCGVKTDGTLWCWGQGYDGVLGLGDVEEALVPTRVGDADDWASVSAAWSSSCAIRESGALYCWGDSAVVGDGTEEVRTTPVAIGTASWRQLAGDYLEQCGIQIDGSMWCWGYNVYGEPSPALAPVRMDDGTDWEDLALGAFQSCGVRTDGTLWCWGLMDAEAVDEPHDVPMP